MFVLLHKYLIDYSSIYLPGIGIMEFVNTPARFDVNHQQIYPSAQKLSFMAEVDAETNVQPQLMAFLAHKLDLPEEQASIMFHHFLDWAKNTIATKNILRWDNIGEFYKTENNHHVLFTPSSDLEQYLQPVSAKENGTRLHSNYPVLVGNDETTSIAIEDHLEGPITIKKSYWWIWAIAIATISGALIAFKYLS